MEHTEQFLVGGGEMGAMIRAKDWSQTPLGPVETWPQSLRTIVSLCLSSTFPILIAWGEETIQIYNDSYRPICGDKHPASLGQNFRICWETALPVVGDKFTRGQQGEGTYIKDQQMFLDRNGYLEEAYMTFSFAPIRNESGEVGGIFHPITETTDKTLGARRTKVLRDIAGQISKAKTVSDICTAIIANQEDFHADLPFLVLYDKYGQLLAETGDAGDIIAPSHIDLSGDLSHTWPFTSSIQVVEQLAERFGEFSCTPYPEPPHTAVLLPIFISGQDDPYAYLAAGVSSRRALDQEYLNFYELLANTISTAFSNVYAYEQEQQRAEALAAIDKAKTTFFSNVSHEFRTPLTLMLGPLEDLMQQPALQDAAFRPSIDATYRNAHRLLKLVNNLLDFSRVEAGRIKALFQPANIAEFTTDLASSFRSIIEKAGMQLLVSCTPVTLPVYVDKEMWEKIVLNLLSNAFKFTLEGSIAVTLQQSGEEVLLEVTDTGTGIPAHELPFMFERFHRVENAVGRTHEGSGIGLSLVSELVHLHGGNISVSSVEGAGTTFSIKIPCGKIHLPAELVSETSTDIDTGLLKGAFLKEAFSLLENDLRKEDVTEEDYGAEYAERTNHHVLVVDDNTDMRNYLARLLENNFIVHTATNGRDALEQLSSFTPDLIVSDIMMPEMDGIELLHHLKKNSETAAIPLIFLSARAGNEARIDGIEAGADDYLVKPFSAKELLTKVKAQIRISKARSHGERKLKNLFEHAPVAISIYKGPDYVVEVANKLMLEYWGKSADDVLYKPLSSALPELMEQGALPAMDEVYLSGKRIITDEIAIEADGKQLYIKLTLEPLYEEDNRISGVMCIADDVTILVTARELALQNTDILEKRVQERTDELTKVNRELEDFAFIASHDLQEPLRKIQMFGNKAISYLSSLDDTGRTYLEKMITSAGRMSRLINDLLTYSRVEKMAHTFAKVDLNEIVQRVTDDFEITIKQKNAILNIGDLPVVNGIPVQMNQLFHNLLSNSLKFSGDHALINLSASVISGSTGIEGLHPDKMYHEIVFSDNGIGFDQKYEAQIFTIFKRLVQPSQYPGTGIGLTICKKIIENHNGLIVPFSEEGVGTDFYIYLPV